MGEGEPDAYIEHMKDMARPLEIQAIEGHY